MEIGISLPSQLRIQEALEFGLRLDSLPDEGRFVFDFRTMPFMTPFGFLYVSQAIRSCRRKRPSAEFLAMHHDTNSYAAHMGFYKDFGLQYGNSPGEAPGGVGYLPISHLNTAAIFQEATQAGKDVGDVLESRSRRLTGLLIQKQSGGLFDALSYCFREMLRNVVEHSGSNVIEYCGQYWATKKRCEIAILDTGVGIHQSLQRNPHLRIESNLHALQLSLLPGISGNIYARTDTNNVWQNSGYGLYMTSSICRRGGSFFIGSKTDGLQLFAGNKQHYPMCLEGTITRLSIETGTVDSLARSLRGLLEDGRAVAQEIEGAILTPSRASQLLRVGGGQMELL